ncbi:MAG TPA: VOC family protein [Nitrososphaera sp.]|nr:VOC family protein [Nitrososphaera sp.]
MSDNLLTRKYPNLNHVGVVIRDIDQAERDNSNRFGLSAITRRFTLHVEDAHYQGKTVTFSAEFGFIELGNTMLELIQPLGNDPSPYLDALQGRGGGGVENIHHLAYLVPSIDEHLEMARKSDAPLSVLFDAKLPDWMGRYVYVDGLVHGVLIELMEFAQQQK